jgi:hypothetical protein
MVRDVDNRHPVSAKSTKDCEQAIRLGAGEGCGRLVEDENSGLAAESASDLDKLALARRERIDAAVGIEWETKRLQTIGCAATDSAAVDPGAKTRLLAERKVLGNRHSPDEAEFLVNDRDTPRDRVGRSREPDGRAIKADLATVRADRTAEHSHQRALAGAVLTAERMDLTSPDDQLDSPECFHSGVVFDHTDKLDAGNVGRLRRHSARL